MAPSLPPVLLRTDLRNLTVWASICLLFSMSTRFWIHYRLPCILHEHKSIYLLPNTDIMKLWQKSLPILFGCHTILSNTLEQIKTQKVIHIVLILDVQTQFEPGFLCQQSVLPNTCAQAINRFLQALFDTRFMRRNEFRPDGTYYSLVFALSGKPEKI